VVKINRKITKVSDFWRCLGVWIGKRDKAKYYWS